MVAAATALARGAADGGKAARSARGLDSGVKRSKKGASHPREMELLLAATRKLANAQAWCDLTAHPQPTHVRERVATCI